jgi:hypothetical protein
MVNKICDSCGGEVKLSGKSKSETFICGVCTTHMSEFCISVEKDDQEFQNMINKNERISNEKKI